MAFRFKLTESFADGFRRIACEQIDRASTQLREDGQPAVTVHETRKTLKRLRALLRLMRPAVGHEAFKAENAYLRDIGLSLSGARDRHVLLETANGLASGGRLGRRVAESLRQAILATNGQGEPVSLRDAAERLASARQRIVALPVAGTGFDVAGEGLEASYREARRAFRRAYAQPSDEAFHEWRKGAQRHWRQMVLLARAWPGYLEARAQEARELSQELGEDHDLAMLVAFAHSDSAANLKGEVAAIVETAARRRQEELRDAARPRGERLFADKPALLRRNIGICWSAAVALKDLQARAEAASAARTVRKSAPRRRPAPPPKA
jgi:CHAD domain-containing protein